MMTTATQPTRCDVIVVGAGHNGLTAGALLARAGLATLVVERRDVVGGCCVTEEIAPGCRASTTSYIASMLRPEVIRELNLGSHGLRMVPCEPALQVALDGGEVLAAWNDPDQTAAEIARFSAADARAYLAADAELRGLAARLQPLFTELPPDTRATGLRGGREVLRLARRLRGVRGRELEGLTILLTGSLGQFIDARFESRQAKALLLANNLYGKHGGPYQPGTLIGLAFHLLTGGEHAEQGFFGHVVGGMGAISDAIASAGRAAGLQIATSAPVARILVKGGRAAGVALEDGTEITAGTVLSCADPKRTFLQLVDKADLPEDFRAAVGGIRMDGPCGKVNLVLDAEPQVRGMPADAGPGRRALFTLPPDLAVADACYDRAKRGELADAGQLFVDCVVASAVDGSLAPPGRHIMTCFVQYLPYRLAEGTWDSRRDELGDRVLARIGQFAPNVPAAVVARQVLTPLDLEREYGLTEGNIFHGDVAVDQLFHMRPVPGWARYATPVPGLYLCGAGAHPGGGVTGAPGYNAARRVLKDLRGGSSRGRGRR
ncbi:phytoene desaturase family protein [Trebonia sp.]|uniref:phytoene desaturase family protein n=1 Tax=Trebonia sp. TaxID=2767075 RepID=UPI00345B77FF